MDKTEITVTVGLTYELGIDKPMFVAQARVPRVNKPAERYASDIGAAARGAYRLGLILLAERDEREATAAAESTYIALDADGVPTGEGS